jgi:site-specific recombinase XerD
MQFTDAVTGFLTGYFSTCKRSSKTEAAYKIDLAQLQVYMGDAVPLQGIGADALERWALELRSRSFATSSIRRKFATLRLFFAYWVRRGVLDRSPLWGIRLDLGRARVLPRCLTPADTKRLMEEMWQGVDRPSDALYATRDPQFLKLRNLAAVEILFATGIRVGELVSLRLGDFREGDFSLVINGKGARQRLAFLPDERSRRAVDLYLRCRKNLKCDHDGFLVNAAGSRISSQGIARMLCQAAQDAGVSIRVTPHMLRHTVATLLLRYGADLRVVQEVLGHASISTTQWYTHISKEHLADTLSTRHPNHHLGILFAHA